MEDLNSRLLEARDKLAQDLDSPEAWDLIVSKALDLVVNSRAAMVVNLLRLFLLDNLQEQEISQVLDQEKTEAQGFLRLRPPSHSLLIPQDSQ